MNRIKTFVFKLLNYLVLVFAASLVIIPLVFVLFTTFKTSDEYFRTPLGFPDGLYLKNYENIFLDFNFLRLFFNSLLLTLTSVLIGSYVSAMASFAFGKMKFKGGNVIFGILIPTMSVPTIVMVIPLFSAFSKIDLVNTFLAPIVIYIGLIVPFSIYLITSFMDTIPNEIIEAAMIDGLGVFGIFHQIILPLSLPAISTVVITQGMWIWNELLIAFIFLQKQEMRTLVVGLTSLQGLYSINIPLMMAGAVVVSLPLIVVFIFSQRFVIRGLVEGAIK